MAYLVTDEDWAEHDRVTEYKRTPYIKLPPDYFDSLKESVEKERTEKEQLIMSCYLNPNADPFNRFPKIIRAKDLIEFWNKHPEFEPKLERNKPPF